MSLTTQKRAASGSGSSRPPCREYAARKASASAVRVQHGEVGAGVGDVEVGRSPRRLGPVDQPGDRVALPQGVAEVEVAVQQPVRRRRRTGRPDLDRLAATGRATGPSPAPPARAGPRKEKAGGRCADRHRLPVHRDGQPRPRGDRGRAEPVQPYPARAPGQQVGRTAGAAPSGSLPSSRGTGSAEPASSRHASASRRTCSRPVAPQTSGSAQRTTSGSPLGQAQQPLRVGDPAARA